MRVLVTGSGAVLGQGIMRSLDRCGLDVDVIAADPSPLAAGLYWHRSRHLIPMARDPGFLEQMQRVVRDQRPDAILIGTDVELPVFAAHRHELESAWDTRIVVSPSTVVAVADDKLLTAQFLGERGFRVPVSGRPGEEDRLIEAVGFPLIVKPRIGARAIGVHLVRRREELRAAVESVTDPVIQECVGDDAEEYTASALVFDGRASASIVMRRDLRDGNTYRAWTDEFPDLNAQVRLMAEALQPYGPANFQFRLDRDGTPVVFEINARFSGTTPLRRLAGFNEVEMVLRKVVLGEPVVQPLVERMMILRHWSETVVRDTDARPRPPGP